MEKVSFLNSLILVELTSCEVSLSKLIIVHVHFLTRPTLSNLCFLSHSPSLSCHVLASPFPPLSILPFLLLSLPATKLPAQSICTFNETLQLLIKPEARHVQLNVDVKLDNDPEVLFELMNREIMKFEDWESELAPRLILGEFSLLRLFQSDSVHPAGVPSLY